MPKHRHEPGDECFACAEEAAGRDPVAAIEAWTKAQLEDHGWYYHMVMLPPWMNSHTHGLPEKYGHPDLQIVIPLPPRTIGSVLWSAVEEIAGGAALVPGVDHDGVLNGMRVRTVESTEGGRAVLRILLPDRHGRFPGDDDCEAPFADQALVDTDALAGDRRQGTA